MTNQDLVQPLLSEEEQRRATASNECLEVDVNSFGEDNESCTTTSESNETSSFSIAAELREMVSLGIPLAVSFFCRMGMASTDSSFVGHINDAHYSAETYLAAATLSDMVLSVCITPPLAFNQVLNALVGQSMGSGNPQMAGIWLQQSMFWLTVSMFPCLVGLFYVEPILKFLDFPSDVAHVAGVYAMYNIIWPIPNGLYQCMRFYFQAQGRAQPAMYNNLIFLFVNALLNWFFVFGGPFQWGGLGFIGAAVSLSISRTMQSVTYFLYMFVYKKHHKATWPQGGCTFQNHTKARTMEFMKQSIPYIGTLLFQVLASQSTTVLVGRLGELSIAASSALSTVTIPWSGSLSATCTTISGVRVGYHLGRGDGEAARKSTWIVLYFITAMNVVMAILFLSPLQSHILSVATNDVDVLELGAMLVPAMLVGAYLNLMVSNITSGVFGGMGKPFLATLLSFGLELPLSIGGVAVYILVFHGNLLGVYWWQAISGVIEIIIVFVILLRANWNQCAVEAKLRQEASSEHIGTEDDVDCDGNHLPLLHDDTDEEAACADPDRQLETTA